MQSALAIRQVPLGPQTPCHQHLGKPHDPMVRAIMTFVAETRCRDICDSSPVRTHAHARVELESVRARGLYTPRFKFAFATVLRAAALPSKLKCFPAAYGARKKAPSPVPRLKPTARAHRSQEVTANPPTPQHMRITRHLSGIALPRTHS